MRIVFDLQACQTPSRSRGIGRYSLALATAVARAPGGHDVWIALNGAFPGTVEPLREAFDGLVPQDQIRVFAAPVPIAEHDPTNAWRQHAAGPIRDSFLAALKPDIVHISNLFEGWHHDAVTSIGSGECAAQVAVTLYDLIPYKMPSIYLTNPGFRKFYYGKMQALKNADLLLAISDFTRSDAISSLNLPAADVVNIRAGIGAHFAPSPLDEAARAAIQQRLGITGNFILYVPGGFDARKNFDNLLEGFARLPPGLRAGHQLVITADAPPVEREKLLDHARALGLAQAVVLAGYVGEAELVALYSSCSLFVFPSLYEGFGLPVLEAMACGAPVICANATSLPEVMDRADALFDPNDPAAIAAVMARFLGDPAARLALSAYGLAQAEKFTWAATAADTIAAFEATHARRTDRTTPRFLRAEPRRKPRLAVVAPLPPVQGDIPNSIANLLPELARYYNIEVVPTELPVDDAWIDANFTGRTRAWFDANAETFDRTLYVAGDAAVYDGIAEAAMRAPGTVLLTEFSAAALAGWQAQTSNDAHFFARALYESHGYRGLAEAAGPKTFPVNLPLLAAAGGLIVPQADFAAQAARWYDLSPENFCVIPALPGEPARRAALVAAAIEDFHKTHQRFHEDRLLKTLAAAPHTPAPGDIAAAALCIDRNAPARRRPQTLFCDVSLIARHDLRTGIQRVTRCLLQEFLKTETPLLRLEPVFDDGPIHRYARRFTLDLLGLNALDLGEDVADIRPGDIFLGVDLNGPGIINNMAKLHAWRDAGVKLYFVIYDIIPITHPHVFPPGSQAYHSEWLRCVVDLADGLLCISQTVAGEVEKWVAANQHKRHRPLKISWFHLGADLQNVNTAGPPSPVVASLGGRPTMLMVGTLEPRKGHLQALEAMELLWAEGVDINLVIVGKEGWLQPHDPQGGPGLIHRLRTHAERGERLFWAEGISDSALESIYAASTGLIAASEAEGFGLPLIEAAQHGLPIIARDIEVFREVAGDHAFYFSGESPRALADAIQEWLVLHAANQAPRSGDMPWITWKESARQLQEIVLGPMPKVSLAEAAQ